MKTVFKQNFFKVLIIVTVFSFSLPFGFEYSSLAEDNLAKSGIVFYNQGEYKTALQILSKAVKENPSNVEAVYYFANTLVKTRNFDYACEYYNKVIDLSPNSQYADYSREVLSYITNYKAKNSKPLASSQVKSTDLYSSVNSYIQKIINRGEIIRWHSDKMPLNVYVQTPFYKEHLQYVWDAFKEWEFLSNGLVSFNKVSSEDEAQIVVKWERIFADSPNYDYYGYALPQINADDLIKYEIFLAELDHNKKIILPTKLFTVALHQIGHSLGINAHSDNKDDIMYFEPTAKNLTRRDVSTLNVLYGLKAKISDFSRPASYNNKEDQNEETSEN